MQGYVPEAWSTETGQHFVLDFSSFIRDENFKKYEPKSGVARDQYQRFVANMFKMSLYLLKDDLKQKRSTSLDETTSDQMGTIQTYLHEVEPSNGKQVDDLIAEIKAIASIAAR